MNLFFIANITLRYVKLLDLSKNESWFLFATVLISMLKHSSCFVQGKGCNRYIYVTSRIHKNIMWFSWSFSTFILITKKRCRISRCYVSLIKRWAHKGIIQSNFMKLRTMPKILSKINLEKLFYILILYLFLYVLSTNISEVNAKDLI